MIINMIMIILVILSLYKLGQCIYNYELKRNRKYKPDLSAFNIHYEKRKEDGRPAIKEIDN